MTDNPTTEIPRVVSVDDHVMEPPSLFGTWLPGRFRDEAPRVERGSIARIEYLGGQDWKLHFSDDGAPGDYWVYDGKMLPMKRINASAGMPLDLRENTPITFDEMRPGCYDVKARLADMDAGHVEASLCFPTMPRFCGQTFAEAADKELALACVRAYNDFMVEEWSGQSGGRLIPLCLVPLWDAGLAAAEVRRNAGRCRLRSFTRSCGATRSSSTSSISTAERVRRSTGCQVTAWFGGLGRIRQA
jgi:Amidohydrolase